jgi:hypothetical protein
MKQLSNKFNRFWEQERSLTILAIILTIHIFIVIPLGQKTIFNKIIFIFFYFFLLYTGVYVLPISKKLRFGLIVLMFLWLILGSGFLFRSVTLDILNDVGFLLYCILLGWIVLMRTFSEGPITFHRIQGAIVVYLLISYIFALLFHAIVLVEGDTVFKSDGLFDRKESMYFSMVTLTTVGYGDITPAVAVTRSLANLESLIGQLYPTILIARLVSMEFESSKNRSTRK